MQGPSLTVDVVIEFPGREIVLIKRGFEPFKGHWALPGGFVEVGETVEEAAVREAKEETGLEIQLQRLIGVYSDPRRDPRRHTVSVVFHARAAGGTLRADSDAADVTRTADFLNMKLAFDHNEIVRDAFSD